MILTMVGLVFVVLFAMAMYQIGRAEENHDDAEWRRIPPEEWYK